MLTQALEKMEQEWANVEFDVMPYKETGTYILKSPDEASQLLDDHIVMTQSMSFSPFKKIFEARINTWEGKLRMTQVRSRNPSAALCVLCHRQAASYVVPLPSSGSLQDVLEEWLTCQGLWLYLEPIFSSDDINEQLPVEGKRYQHMENTWRRIMKSAFHKRKVRGAGETPLMQRAKGLIECGGEQRG